MTMMMMKILIKTFFSEKKKKKDVFMIFSKVKKTAPKAKNVKSSINLNGKPK